MTKRPLTSVKTLQQLSRRRWRHSLWFFICLVMAASFLIRVNAHGASQVLIGDQKIESSNDSNSSGQAEAFKATATASGQLSTLTVYVNNSASATKLVAGLYTNGPTNHPAALLAQGTLTTLAKGSWNTVNLTTQPQITAGTIYWITILSPSGAGTIAFRDVSGGGNSETSSSKSLGSLPASWTTGSTYKDGSISAYGSAVVTPDTSPPSAPANLTVGSPTQTGITLNWAASTDNVGVSGYNLYLNSTKVGTTAATNFNFSGLSCATSYTLGVEAFDAAGNVSAQSSLNATTAACPDTSSPTSPTNLLVTGTTDSSISISWTASTDNVGVTGYDIYDGTASTAVATTTQTTYTLTGLTCNMIYNLSVDAYDAAGNKSSQAFTTAQTAACPPDTTPPTAPSNLTTSSITASSISLSWTASTDNLTVSGYGIYLNGALQTTTTSLNYVFNGLSCATTYTLGVDAFDAAGNRSAQSTINGTTASCPDTTPPSINMTAPADGSTISGSITVSAAATDNVAVASVQFQLDGTNLGTAVTSAPYQISWNSSSVSNGTHTLAAVATDTSGNSAAATAVTVTISNVSPTTPTPVPDSSVYGVKVGDGIVEASAREVVRTANNTVYIITANDNSCQGGGAAVIQAWKGSGAQPSNASVPTGFTEVDAAHHPVAPVSADCTFNGGTSATLGSPDIRLDANGIIHLAYIEGSSANVYYQTFSTITDTWGPRTTVSTAGENTDGGGWPRYGQVALTIDANNAPYIVYMTGGSANRVMYTNMINGSWSTPVTIASGTNAMHPSLVTAPDGSLQLAWLDNSLATQSVIKYSHYANGSWSTPETVSAGDNVVLANGDSDQGPSITTDSSNTPFVLYMDGTVNGSNDYVRIRYRAASGVWTDNTPPGGNGGTSNPAGTLFAHTPQIYTSASNGQYAFLGHDKNIQFGYQYQLGGAGTDWAAYITLDPQSASNPLPGDTCEPGPDGSASVRFDPNHDNNTGIIDVIYFDERDDSDCAHHHAQVFYKAIVIGANSNPTPPPASDTTAPTVSVTEPANDSTVSGNITLSANASDNVAVSSVKYQLDGSDLAPAVTSAPYNLNWDTTAVTNGNHTLAAVATDSSGNATTSSTLTVTVNNMVAAPTSSLLSQGKPASASSVNTSAGSPSYVTDGNLSTRWSSNYSDPQWIYIDLGATYNITEVALYWETAYGKAYQIQVSNDAVNWTTIYSTAAGTGGSNDLTNLSGSGRYVRMYGTVRGTQWGYSLWEFKVFGY